MGLVSPEEHQTCIHAERDPGLGGAWDWAPCLGLRTALWHRNESDALISLRCSDRLAA
jgi:hypothetical protein